MRAIGTVDPCPTLEITVTRQFMYVDIRRTISVKDDGDVGFSFFSLDRSIYSLFPFCTLHEEPYRSHIRAENARKYFSLIYVFALFSRTCIQRKALATSIEFSLFIFLRLIVPFSFSLSFSFALFLRVYRYRENSAFVPQEKGRNRARVVGRDRKTF